MRSLIIIAFIFFGCSSGKIRPYYIFDMEVKTWDINNSRSNKKKNIVLYGDAKHLFIKIDSLNLSFIIESKLVKPFPGADYTCVATEESTGIKYTINYIQNKTGFMYFISNTNNHYPMWILTYGQRRDNF